MRSHTTAATPARTATARVSTPKAVSAPAVTAPQLAGVSNYLRPVLERLPLGPAHDSAEREADRGAQALLRGARFEPQSRPGAPVQARGGSGTVSSLPRSGGQPLPAALSRRFGRSLGQSLDGVRVHSDARAGALARSVGAQAFTQGQDLYFAPGLYAPHTPQGQELLAHEIVHVAQQARGAAPVIQRRAMTAQEEKIGEHMEKVANEAEKETTPYSGPTVAAAFRNYKSDLEADVRGVSAGKSDPDRLLAALWALHVWRVTPSNYARSKAVTSAMKVRDVDAGGVNYKCNRFVGDAYAVGAKKGYDVHGAGGAYPTGDPHFWDSRPAYPPSANELASDKPAAGNLTNLSETQNAYAGNIIAFKGLAMGHTGLVLGRGLYISARDSKERPAVNTQVEDGVQVTKIPGDKEKTLREFRPPGASAGPAPSRWVPASPPSAEGPQAA